MSGIKVVIIGAGPAGLSAGIHALREGYEVVIYEREKRLGVKPCAGGTFEEALSCIPFSTEEVVLTKLRGCSLLYKGKPLGVLETKEMFGCVVDKPRLLELMASHLTSEGGKLIFETEVKDVSPDGRVLTKNGVEKADLVVCSDGANTLARGLLSLSDFEVTPCLQRLCKVRLDDELAYLDFQEDGYAWAFPRADGTANIGVSLKGDWSSALRKFMRAVNAKPLGEPEYGLLPTGGLAKRFRLGKLVVAGDSAGQVMVHIGEGIRFALYAGSICYKDYYQKAFMRRYGRRIRRSSLVRKMLNALDDDKRESLFKEAASSGKFRGYRLMLKLLFYTLRSKLGL